MKEVKTRGVKWTRTFLNLLAANTATEMKTMELTLILLEDADGKSSHGKSHEHRSSQEGDKILTTSLKYSLTFLTATAIDRPWKVFSRCITIYLLADSSCGLVHRK
jgi:hypothetical protein